MKYLFLIVAFFTASISFAQNEAMGGHALMSPAEIDIKIKAKKRLYPGGADEESLKVQTQMPQISRKMSPVTDAPIEEGEEPSEGM